MRVELYNLRDDIGEQHDSGEPNAGQSRELRTRLHDIGGRKSAPNADAKSATHRPSKPGAQQ